MRLILLVTKMFVDEMVHNSGTLYTPTNKANITRARLIKRTISQSEAFTKSIPESHTEDEQASEQRWEDQILVRAQYSLNGLKMYAGTQMQDGGGTLWVFPY